MTVEQVQIKKRLLMSQRDKALQAKDAAAFDRLNRELYALPTLRVVNGKVELSRLD